MEDFYTNFPSLVFRVLYTLGLRITSAQDLNALSLMVYSRRGYLWNLVFLKGVYWDPFFFFYTSMTCLMLLVPLHASIALFADDAKCYRVVRNAEDCLSFQHDLYSVYDWSEDWGLSYNTNKCEVLRISRKRRNPSNLSTVNPYAIDGHPLALVPSTKDLGMIVNNKLTWSSHISSVVAKANKTLGFL